jgi:hypothetical protein
VKVAKQGEVVADAAEFPDLLGLKNTCSEKDLEMALLRHAM